MAACKSCRFWNPLESSPGVGDCRRHAPVVILSGDYAGQDTQPCTNNGDWCGDYEAKPAEKSEADA